MTFMQYEIRKLPYRCWPATETENAARTVSARSPMDAAVKFAAEEDEAYGSHPLRVHVRLGPTSVASYAITTETTVIFHAEQIQSIVA